MGLCHAIVVVVCWHMKFFLCATLNYTLALLTSILDILVHTRVVLMKLFFVSTIIRHCVVSLMHDNVNQFVIDLMCTFFTHKI